MSNFNSLSKRLKLPNGIKFPLQEEGVLSVKLSDLFVAQLLEFTARTFLFLS